MQPRKQPLKTSRAKLNKPVKGRFGLKPKQKSLTKLMKECDALFSKRVRNIKAWTSGWNECFTCKKLFPIKKLHCGHYLSRYYKAARWNYDNCRPQCMMCNLWRKGDAIRFRQNLVKEIGEARVLAVEALRDASVKLTREMLEQLKKDLSV